MVKRYETEASEMVKPIKPEKTRRGFLKKAAIGSAVVTTVTSRPVWAGQCALSGNLSNNASSQLNQQPCYVKGYSPGAWCNGHAANNNLYQYIPLNKHTPLRTFFGPSAPDALVKDALPNCGGNPKKLAPDVMWQAKWRQKVTALLNSFLWHNMTRMCKNDPNCDFMTNAYLVSPDFYYPWTLEEIKYKTLPALEAANCGLDPNGCGYNDLSNNGGGHGGGNDDDDDDGRGGRGGDNDDDDD